MGKEDYEGTIAFRKGVVPGYLEQMPEYGDEFTGAMVLDMAFENLYKIKRQIKKPTLFEDICPDLSSINVASHIKNFFMDIQLTVHFLSKA